MDEVQEPNDSERLNTLVRALHILLAFNWFKMGSPGGL
jgi:hypothetical protein